MIAIEFLLVQLRELNMNSLWKNTKNLQISTWTIPFFCLIRLILLLSPCNLIYKNLPLFNSFKIGQIHVFIPVLRKARMFFGGAKVFWWLLHETNILFQEASEVREQSLRVSMALKNELIFDIEDQMFQGDNRKTKNQGPEHSFVWSGFLKQWPTN